MRAKGLKGVSRRKFVVTTKRDPRVRPANDLVDRNFYTDAPNVLLVADIINVPTWAGFLYLALVLDGYRCRFIACCFFLQFEKFRIGFKAHADAARQPDRLLAFQNMVFQEQQFDVPTISP